MSHHESAGIWGGSYFLGFLGAVTYFLQNADSFWMGVVGIFKAIFWPGFLVYYLFEFLKL